MSVGVLRDIVRSRAAGAPAGITSVCSAHPLVNEAALVDARDRGTDGLIEAACDPVNQDGGSTGMTPAAFHNFVLSIADRAGHPSAGVILGGDHLGPNPLRRLPAEAATGKAEATIAAARDVLGVHARACAPSGSSGR